MKKIIKNIHLIKQYIGSLSLITGVGIFVYNIFNFDNDVSSGLGKYAEYGYNDDVTDRVIHYFYWHDTLILIAIGAMLITLGILILRKSSN